MTRTRHLRSVLSASAALLLSVTTLPALGADADSELVQWSDLVWSKAHAGDTDTLMRLLNDLPEAGEGIEQVARFRSSLEQLGATRTRADSERAKTREEAIEELHENVEAENLTEALRSAIRVQDASGDLNEIFGDGDVLGIVKAAHDELPDAESEGDWLKARELLFLLRTLYEDTTRSDAYRDADRHLSAVNRRISLLAQYAPRHLHELRVRAAERAEEEPPAEFNPATVLSWEERVQDIDVQMLRAALTRAAIEHIETEGSEGWRMLILGGLEALRIMATTPGLEESFETLADKERVSPWVSFLEQQIARYSAARDDDMGRNTLTMVINDLVRKNGLTVGLDRRVLYHEFGDGAIYKLDEMYDDPYSEIVWPTQLRRFRQQTEGNFIGVGILIRHNEKREILVVNPLEGTPAYFAGIKPNDLIIEVDGESAVGWSLNDAVDRITGPKGKAVTLGIRRDGVEELIEVPIVRDIIKLRTVKGWFKEGLDDHGDPVWDWYVDPLSRIAYVRLTQFTEDTFADLRAAVDEMSRDGRPSGLILDLRYNPGGLLSSAVDVSNEFIQEGIIVSGEDKYGNKAFPDQKANWRNTELKGIPTVVLINKGSASASEIVAGCLQAHGAALVVGERSYGKGSVQTVHHVTSKARMKLTTHYYRLPPAGPGEKGRLVHKRPGAKEWGVEPDIVVKMTSNQVQQSLELRQKVDLIPEDEEGHPDPGSEERGDVTELLSEGLDPQLQTALLILQARALGDLGRSRHARLID